MLLLLKSAIIYFEYFLGFCWKHQIRINLIQSGSTYQSLTSRKHFWRLLAWAVQRCNQYLSNKKSNLPLNKNEIYGKTAVICAIGCGCDLISAYFYDFSAILSNETFGVNISPTNPYANMPSFIMVVITLLLASSLIYTFDYLYLVKNQKMDRKTAKFIALMFVAFTSPYLFFVPSPFK